jgi:hypothetical protein
VGGREALCTHIGENSGAGRPIRECQEVTQEEGPAEWG